ncbi:MAG: hypothetical protein DRR08_07415 [Candidatus Parabeggiatoa sp. nov. 2]|nr:MAG: hypothetical protein B6247_07140 [Beggiatoa sp. 4572_84]RKZ61917.1 MAG: hypothetical protein DRR08_07415 [Gammaproteobacteria bacterium]
MKKWRSHRNGNAIFLIHLGAVPIDFHKNNITLSDPLPQIPYLKWARVRLNILAFIYLKPKIFCTNNLFFGNVYIISKKINISIFQSVIVVTPKTQKPIDLQSLLI